MAFHNLIVVEPHLEFSIPTRLEWLCLGLFVVQAFGVPWISAYKPVLRRLVERPSTEAVRLLRFRRAA